MIISGIVGIKPVFMGKVLEFSNKREYEVNVKKLNTIWEKKKHRP